MIMVLIVIEWEALLTKYVSKWSFFMYKMWTKSKIIFFCIFRFVYQRLKRVSISELQSYQGLIVNNNANYIFEGRTEIILHQIIDFFLPIHIFRYKIKQICKVMTVKKKTTKIPDFYLQCISKSCLYIFCLLLVLKITLIACSLIFSLISINTFILL